MKKTKKILILHCAHWDQLLGGAELQLSYLTDYLINEGHEVHFLFPKRNDKIVKSNCFLHELKKPPKFLFKLGKVWFLYSKKIKQKIEEINPEIVITRTFTSWSGIVSKIARNKKIRHLHFIASDNDLKKDSPPFISLFRPLNFIEFKNAKKTYNDHTQFIVQNHEQYEMLNKNFGLDSILLNQAAPENNKSLIKKSDICIL